MKVKVRTGRRYRPTVMVDVALTTFRGAPCVEIHSKYPIHYVDLELPEVLTEDYDEIATSCGLLDYEYDERDQHTMWIWQRDEGLEYLQQTKQIK